MSLGFFFPHSTAYLALLCMIMATVGALGGTMGFEVVQQASASCCKVVHPYRWQMLDASHAVQQAAMKRQTLCFDWRVAIGMQQRLLQPKKSIIQLELVS